LLFGLVLFQGGLGRDIAFYGRLLRLLARRFVT
jgi:hypothetical protein